MPNIGEIIINMHNKAILYKTNRKTHIVFKLCNCTDPAPALLKENAVNSQPRKMQPSCQKLSQWFTTAAVKQNSKANISATKDSNMKVKYMT